MRPFLFIPSLLTGISFLSFFILAIIFQLFNCFNLSILLRNYFSLLWISLFLLYIKAGIVNHARFYSFLPVTAAAAAIPSAPAAPSVTTPPAAASSVNSPVTPIITAAGSGRKSYTKTTHSFTPHQLELYYII
ncbi:hypothetical protein [Lacrimispora sp.]|uniref:hypothetical protein n=1 Tax=Lacrimispora sp. TaxID=2719234 RepID=UPI0034611A43